MKPMPAVAEPAPPDPRKVITRLYRLDFVSNLPSVRAAILGLIEAASWTGQGGTGSIVIVDHTLIIKNQIAVQKEVEKLLTQLYRADGSPQLRRANDSNLDDNGNPQEGFRWPCMGCCVFRVPPAAKPRSFQRAD